MTMEWRELEHEPVADCRIFSVERSRAVSPFGGEPREFYRLITADWVQILPITADGEAVLVRQYRHGAGRTTLEVPGGLVDPGEDPRAAAIRECFEETGYRATRAISLGYVNPNPALFGNRLHTFYAENVALEGAVQNTGTEHTEAVLVPMRDIADLLRSGAIDHALVACLLWRYLHERVR